MTTITDYQGRELTGAVREMPERWFEVTTSDTKRFVFYKAGIDDVYAVVEFDHRVGGWVWRLHAGSIVEVAGNEFATPCTTALQGIRAVQRAARRFKLENRF